MGASRRCGCWARFHKENKDLSKRKKGGNVSRETLPLSVCGEALGDCNELDTTGKMRPKYGHRGRPDSPSSSDGDDPPLRRPRNAGFIALPLAAIIFAALLGVIPIRVSAPSLPKARCSVRAAWSRPSPAKAHLVRRFFENIGIFNKSVNEQVRFIIENKHPLFKAQSDRAEPGFVRERFSGWDNKAEHWLYFVHWRRGKLSKEFVTYRPLDYPCGASSVVLHLISDAGEGGHFRLPFDLIKRQRRIGILAWFVAESEQFHVFKQQMGPLDREHGFVLSVRTLLSRFNSFLRLLNGNGEQVQLPDSYQNGPSSQRRPVSDDERPDWTRIFVGTPIFLLGCICGWFGWWSVDQSRPVFAICLFILSLGLMQFGLVTIGAIG
jgi:hypothetical protein